ncbi:hypothetical protein BCR44DRAFT_1423623 [Catenaria anguillulae PL171]|uniref:Uncharacterized protein n=1 Tax=Catenaria anguillulae PL171 TaxID=765915 RepID=A0A1Y2I1G5_9FUNG|nr:hypothetical protein BCR44DRAFT_1423623 [Catenaria anguillulae PL171]
MPQLPSPDAAALFRRATPSAPSSSSAQPSNDANVALVAIIASASFIFLLMLVCVCRSLRRHPMQPGCLHWFIGRSAPRPAETPRGTPAAAGTSPRRLSVIQDEITREYYRRSAIMAVAGPRGGSQIGFPPTSGWDPSKPPSEVFTPPPAYLPDRPISYHELPMAAASSSQVNRSTRSSVLRDSLPESPTVLQSANAFPSSPSTSRRTRPQTIDDVLGLAATSPELRAADPPPPAYAPFSDIPLVDMDVDVEDDDNLPVGHGAGRRSYLAGHVRFAQQHDRARHQHHHEPTGRT